MKTIAILLACLTLTILPGCPCGQEGARRGALSAPPSLTVVSRGLSVGITISRRTLAVGETMEVLVVAKNVTRAPIEIHAPTSVPALVKVWRYTGVGWDEVKRYPENNMLITRTWCLPPGGSREFAFRLPVEPDWPLGELLRVSGELNGRPDAIPSVTFDVTGKSVLADK